MAQLNDTRRRNALQAGVKAKPGTAFARTTNRQTASSNSDRKLDAAAAREADDRGKKIRDITPAVVQKIQEEMKAKDTKAKERAERLMWDAGIECLKRQYVKKY